MLDRVREARSRQLPAPSVVRRQQLGQAVLVLLPQPSGPDGHRGELRDETADVLGERARGVRRDPGRQQRGQVGGQPELGLGVTRQQLLPRLPEPIGLRDRPQHGAGVGGQGPATVIVHGQHRGQQLRLQSGQDPDQPPLVGGAGSVDLEPEVAGRRGEPHHGGPGTGSGLLPLAGQPHAVTASRRGDPRRHLVEERRTRPALHVGGRVGVHGSDRGRCGPVLASALSVPQGSALTRGQRSSTASTGRWSLARARSWSSTPGSPWWRTVAAPRTSSASIRLVGKSAGNVSQSSEPWST